MALDESAVSAAGFGGEDGGGGGALGLRYQHSDQSIVARGDNLGLGMRSAPPYQSALFDSPPTPGRSLSGAQFGGGHAKSTMNESEEVGG